MINGYVNAPKSLSAYVSEAIPGEPVSIPTNTPIYDDFDAFMLAARNKIPIATVDIGFELISIIGSTSHAGPDVYVHFKLGEDTLIITRTTDGISIDVRFAE